MDNKELRPGTTLYLPVFNKGALFIAGDGHGVQGDGEVCISALETALTGSFRLTVRKDLGYRHPFAESAAHLISIGLDEDLDDAASMPCGRWSSMSWRGRASAAAKPTCCARWPAICA
jgi:acetamidase/formamidase